MKELTATMPDEIFDSVKEMLLQIPDLKIQENKSIPEWHKSILDNRYENYLKNPKRGRTFAEYKKYRMANG